MATPRIGITTYAPNEKGWFELPSAYVDSIRRAGGLPILLPPGEDHLTEWLEGVDAVILSGGGDIGPHLYGGRGHGTNYRVHGRRDLDELELVRGVMDQGVPTFCICRGTQVLNIAFGGTLIEHIPDAIDSHIDHRMSEKEHACHGVTVEPDSLVARIMGATEVVPASWHHQAIGDLADGFRVVARAPDGVIEAIESPGHPWLLAVQWHPEITSGSDPTQQRLFDGLVAAARGGRQRKES